MALDRQRILGELGSVMKQLQNADCGCLGKLFGNSQQAAQPMMGSPLPTCGGCRRACCHGHGYGQHNSPTSINHPTPNMDCMPMEGVNSSQPTISGNMYGFGPQIVNMMRGNHSIPQNITAQEQMNESIQQPLTGSPQNSYGNVGLTPFTPSSMIQKQEFVPSNMTQGDVSRQMQNKFLSQPNIGNITNLNPAVQSNISSNSAVPQTQTPQMNSWPHQNITSTPAAYQTTSTNYNPYSQHSQGIAKFNKIFPGVRQGLEGDLGFDPMAIAIQMNPDNQLQSAMNTMNKLMFDNKDQKLSKTPELQLPVAGNIVNENHSAIDGTMQQDLSPDHVAQVNVNQIANQQDITQDRRLLHQQYANAYGQPIPQQNQHIYATAVDSNALNLQAQQENPKLNDQKENEHQRQLHQHQEVKNLTSDTPNLPLIQHGGTTDDHQLNPSRFENPGYPNQLPKEHRVQEPIFPVDTSKNLMYMAPTQPKSNNYVYNTLGQPVEMLSAKMYHPTEPSLPQTLSPQPNPLKSKMSPMKIVNVKNTVSKTSVVGNRQTGKSSSKTQFQRICNQYKGSQSYTQQNVGHPSEGTYSTGRLNVPHETKPLSVPVERVGGDTIVENTLGNQDRRNKVEQLIGQIGDVPTVKPTTESLLKQEPSAPIRKSRNGLQDMVFSSYPTSTAWTFHGHDRNDHSPTPRYRHRVY